MVGTEDSREDLAPFHREDELLVPDRKEALLRSGLLSWRRALLLHFVHRETQGVKCQVLRRERDIGLGVPAFERHNLQRVSFVSNSYSLKPENILVDIDGYAKLTDFGLSKENMKKDNLATSFCGTCEYLAPEIINKQPYGIACDWWSFGCVLYEMLTGVPPFYGKKNDEIFYKIRF